MLLPQKVAEIKKKKWSHLKVDTKKHMALHRQFFVFLPLARPRRQWSSHPLMGNKIIGDFPLSGVVTEAERNTDVQDALDDSGNIIYILLFQMSK